MISRILLVEDDPGVALVVGDLLRSEGHVVEAVPDGVSACRRVAAEPFDLLILDVMLPGMDGLEVCRAVRTDGFGGAILMLTARGLAQDRVAGLRTGADDYLVKPFDPDELVARVEALLRRVRREPTSAAGGSEEPRAEFGDVVADFSRRELIKGDGTLTLSGKEAELLRLLVRHRGAVLSRERILQQVWREQPFITPRTVDVHVAWLRQKIEDEPQAPRHVVTVRGEGYRFVG